MSFWCCCTPTPCAKITRTVYGCNSHVLTDATWTLKQGATTVDSGSTDGSGQFSTILLTSGTYDLTVSRGRFVDYTGSITITCPQADDTGTITLAVDSTNYVCCPYCTIPYAKTLNGTTPGGTGFTLTYSTSTPNVTWIGSVAVSLNPWNCGGASTQSVSLQLWCNSDGTWEFLWSTFTGFCPPFGSPKTSATYGGAGTFIRGEGLLSAVNCSSPLSLSFTGGSTITVDNGFYSFTLASPFSGSTPITE